jgi:hypothetical protein
MVENDGQALVGKIIYVEYSAFTCHDRILPCGSI